MESLDDIVGFKNRKIYQNRDFFCFSLDSLLLAYYTEICYIDLVNNHKRHNKKTYSDSPQKAVAYFYVKEKKKARKTL